MSGIRITPIDPEQELVVDGQPRDSLDIELSGAPPRPGPVFAGAALSGVQHAQLSPASDYLFPLVALPLAGSTHAYVWVVYDYADGGAPEVSSLVADEVVGELMAAAGGVLIDTSGDRRRARCELWRVGVDGSDVLYYISVSLSEQVNGCVLIVGSSIGGQPVLPVAVGGDYGASEPDGFSFPAIEVDIGYVTMLVGVARSSNPPAVSLPALVSNEMVRENIDGSMDLHVFAAEQQHDEDTSVTVEIATSVGGRSAAVALTIAP